MLIVFDIRDDLLSLDQAADLAQKSALWTLCQEWRVIPLHHLEPIPEENKKSTKPKPTKRTAHKKVNGSE